MKPYYDRGGITIYCGENVKTMRDVLGDNSIDLTVTSPPYDLVDEDMITHSDKGLRDYQGYEWDFVSVAKELWRVTAEGGVAVWVVGDATIDGSETGTSFRQALYFKDVGFKLHDTMIFQRKTKPLTHNRYEQEFEYMFVLGKKKPNVVNLITVKAINTGRIFPPTMPHYQNGKLACVKYKKKETKNNRIKGNIWEYGIGGSNKKHPAIFPESLARDHIISWSNPDSLILDPFLGSGTTLKMAQQLGRRGIGIEISEDYCKIAVERLRQPSFFSIPDQAKAITSEQLAIDFSKK